MIDTCEIIAFPQLLLVGGGGGGTRMVEVSHILLDVTYGFCFQLRRLERIRAEILELKQSTVAEIRSYQKPPAIVHTVMTGTFLLLGNSERETKASISHH